MLFWHIGASILLFRYLFKDPGVDLRYLVAGALISDVIDKPIGRIIWADVYQSGRIYGHTLLFMAVLLAAVMILTKRGTAGRKRWVAFVIGVMFHLILDGMWTIPETLVWPLLGTEFPPSIEDYWSGFLGRIFSSPLVLAQEAAGLAYLVYLWRAADLSDPQRRQVLYRTGTIATPARG